MTIENARYTEDGSILAVIDGQTLTVPDDMGNRHRRMIAESGVEIAAYVAPTPPVPMLTPRQIRLALLSTGITEDQVDAALAGNDAGLIEWKFANQFKRDHPLIDAMAGAFGLSEAQVDALWAGAADL